MSEPLCILVPLFPQPQRSLLTLSLVHIPVPLHMVLLWPVSPLLITPYSAGLSFAHSGAIQRLRFSGRPTP